MQDERGRIALIRPPSGGHLLPHWREKGEHEETKKGGPEPAFFQSSIKSYSRLSATKRTSPCALATRKSADLRP